LQLSADIGIDFSCANSYVNICSHGSICLPNNRQQLKHVVAVQSGNISLKSYYGESGQLMHKYFLA